VIVASLRLLGRKQSGPAVIAAGLFSFALAVRFPAGLQPIRSGDHPGGFSTQSGSSFRPGFFQSP